MSIMSKVVKPINKPVIATICGDAGMGKTTLACTFPNPIVIRAEDGLQSIPEKDRPDAFPVLQSYDDLKEQMRALAVEPHNYKTLVIDSVSALERLFIQQVIDEDPNPKKPKGIQQAMGGYGNGREAVAGMHANVRKMAGILSEKRGMHVIFISHVEPKAENPPDNDPYSKYGLRMHAKSEPYYIDDVDMVGFLRLEMFTTGDGEKKKVISDGSRILVCHAVASNVSKNRFGITEPIQVEAGKNPFGQFIPALASGLVKKEKVAING